MKPLLPKTLLLALLVCSSLSLAAQEDIYYSTTQEKPESEQFDASYNDFRVTLGGGLAYRLGTLDPSYSAMTTSNPRIGSNFDAELQYFVKKHVGIGFNLNYVKNSVSLKGDNYEHVNLYKGSAIRLITNGYNDHSCLYLGSSFTYRIDMPKFIMAGNVGLGAIFFTEYTSTTNATLKASATALGMNAGLGIEYKIANNVGLGVKVSLTSGSAKTIQFEGGEETRLDKPESLSNAMLTAFISFRSW